MTDVWEALKHETRPIFLYGAGDGAQKIYDQLKKEGVKISGVFASDGFKKDRYFQGHKLIPYSEAKSVFGQFLTLFAFGSNDEKVLIFIKSLAESSDLLCAEMPVCNSEPFNLEFAKQHKDELSAVYNNLADEQSKKVFEQTVLFKLDGNVMRLFECETDRDEAFENILKLKSGSSFLDLGAYTGDTCLEFSKRVQDYSHITAVEPDKKSFLKLKQNTSLLNINYVNAAISDNVGTIPFTYKSSRGSVSGGKDVCDTITIDSLNTSFDYIKFDVEGQELNAIKGGENTIKNERPKMLISCYHRIEDYFKIPLEVLRIRPDYKLYMRHHPYVPAWDTNFYFV